MEKAMFNLTRLFKIQIRMILGMTLHLLENGQTLAGGVSDSELVSWTGLATRTCQLTSSASSSARNSNLLPVLVSRFFGLSTGLN